MQVEELATKGTGRGIISCMHIRPLTVFAICVLATVAKADKFWLGSAEPKGQAQGSSWTASMACCSMNLLRTTTCAWSLAKCGSPKIGY